MTDNISSVASSGFQLPSKLTKLSHKERRIIEYFIADREKIKMKFSKKTHLVNANLALEKATHLVNKDLAKWKTERPDDYKKGLLHSNTYSDDDLTVRACEGRCYGLPQGTFIAGKIVGVFVTLLGRINGKIGLLGIYIYSP